MAKTHKFRVGDRVRFALGMRPVEGRVTEDRGPIGIKGRRLYRVEFDAEPGSPYQVELPAEQLESLPRAAAAG